jgi:hypothetical protein
VALTCLKNFKLFADSDVFIEANSEGKSAKSCFVMT